MKNKGKNSNVFLIKGGIHEMSDVRNSRNRGDLKARLLFCLFFFFFIFGSIESNAQSVSARTRGTVENRDSIVPFSSRWALKTNAVDWLLMLPNLTAEFDLFGSPYKHYTISLGVRGNLNSKQTNKPYMVYDLMNVRGELRSYYRTTQQNYVRPDTMKINFLKRMSEDVFTIKRLHPRYWRAYYWGLYADAADYTFKFGTTGIEGTSYGAGLSGGFSVPLYGYRRNFIDLELGASAGFVYAKYSKFTRDAAHNSYPRVAGGSNGRVIPVINEVRVAFVYRFSASVRDKYKLIDHEKINAKQVAKQKQKTVRDSMSTARLKEYELRAIKRDSLSRGKVKEKELKALVKDSLSRERMKGRELRALLKDSLSRVAKQDRLMTDSLKQVKKQEHEQAKQLEKAEKEKEKADAKGVVTPPVTEGVESTVTLKEEGKTPSKKLKKKKKVDKKGEQSEESKTEESITDKGSES